MDESQKLSNVMIEVCLRSSSSLWHSRDDHLSLTLIRGVSGVQGEAL